MKPKQFQYYKFESMVGPKAGLYPIQDEHLTRLGVGTTVSINHRFKFEETYYDTFFIRSFGATDSLGGYIEISDSSTPYPYVIAAPWANYNGLTLKDIEVQQFINEYQFKLKPLGLWYKKLDNCLLVRWRHIVFESATNFYTHYYEYDCVFYDSGVIEYRYSPLQKCLTQPAFDGRIIETNKSARLGLIKVVAKGEHEIIETGDPALYSQDSLYGGKRYATVVDPPFNAMEQLNYQSWPGKPNGFGAAFRFVPPPDHIKKVLPRKLLREQDTNSNIDSLGLFDDRASVSYSEQVFNGPTHLPHLFGQGSIFGSAEYSLYSDFVLTSSVAPSAINPWIPVDPWSMTPYSETQQPEQNLKPTEYYITGSHVTDVGLGFDGNLGQKTKFVYELPIRAQKVLHPLSASLVYYDNRTNSFVLSGEVESRENFYNLFGDAKLYTPLGTQVAHGVYQESAGIVFSHPWGGDTLAPDVINKSSHYVLKENTNWDPSHSFSVPDEDIGRFDINSSIEPLVFENRYNAPFLLEKVIIELPICAGPGWMNDVTRMHYFGEVDDVGFKIFDVGGPCVTVGLIREIRNKKLDGFKHDGVNEYANFRHREVMVSGTIIPIGDNTGSYSFRDAGLEEFGYPVYQLVLSGFNSYSSNPGAVISSSAGSYFTGSTSLNLIPQVANVFYYSYGETPTSNINPTSSYGYGSNYLDLFDGNAIFENMKPLSISGLDHIHDNRNVFGVNNSMYQLSSQDKKKSLFVKNPWSQFDMNVISSSINIITGEAIGGIPATQHVGLNGVFKNSPYLMYPGDKFTFFVSKYRPVVSTLFEPVELMKFGTGLSDIVHGDGPSEDTFSEEDTVGGGSLGHDIKINTGSLKITLYGSYITDKHEWNSSPDESLYTRQITKVIGDEPVFDQYEVYSDMELLGTSFDNYVAGIDSDYSKLLLGTYANSTNRARITGASYGKTAMLTSGSNDYKSVLIKA